MVNAWSLAYEELYGDMDKEYPIMTKEKDDVTILGGDGNDTIEIKSAYDHLDVDFPTGNVFGADTVSFSDYDGYGMDQITFGTASADTLNIGYPISTSAADTLDFSGYAGTAYNDPMYYVPGTYPDPFDSKPRPNLKYKSQKYGEDKGIADLKDYVSSTYQGHYTNDNSDVQTLDLIHSVGDAESFCRSNALKYLSRYDKKGSAKRDILKAMHYCLLLYYFSGQTNETPTRGYETF